MKRLLCIVTLAFCCGCGRIDGPIRVAVAGNATVDGTPITEGSITFLPMSDTKGPVAGSPIVDGRYSIAAEKGPCVGHYRVEIRGSRKTGRQVPAPGPNRASSLMVDEVIEIVPAKYNTQSTLVAELKTGANTLDFAVGAK